MMNGFNNLVAGNSFNQGWRSAVASGALSGALSGAVSGGIAGGKAALKSGKNVWWGSEVESGRTQWSFINSEKPTIYKFDVKNRYSINPNDCVPSTLAETDHYFGRGDNYD